MPFTIHKAFRVPHEASVEPRLWANLDRGRPAYPLCYDRCMVYRMREDTLDRMVLAVDRVRDRLRRAATILDQAGIAYAVIGGNAVAAWVSQVDIAAVRNTQDVDILLRREDLAAAQLALEEHGFVYRHAASLDMFLDGAEAKARDALHIVFAGEKLRPEAFEASPGVDRIARLNNISVLELEPLVHMKLTSFRDKDRVHLRDMLEVGLIGRGWLQRLPGQLAIRLQQLLDNPEG